MTKKKPKSAKSVEKTIPSSESTEDVPSEQPEEAPSPVMPIDLSKVDKSKIKLAEEMGIPVGQILNWMGTVEARFNAIQEQMPQQIQQAMTQAIENAQRRQREEYAKAVKDGTIPQGGGGGIGLGDILKVIGGSGGGGESWVDAEMKGMFKDMIRTNLTSRKRETSILENVGVAVISKITGKTVSDVVKEVLQ